MGINGSYSISVWVYLDGYAYLCFGLVLRLMSTLLVPNSCYFLSLNTGSLQSFDDIALGLDTDGILQPRPEPYSSPTHIPSPKLLLTWKFCSFLISWQHAKVGDVSLIYRQKQPLHCSLENVDAGMEVDPFRLEV